jgi:DNA polymerase (family X)
VTGGAELDNGRIAERLEAFAVLLDLSGANPYSARAYRRAAELVRATKAPVADLVRAGRVRELRGIGPAIEARLRELA